MVLVKHPEYPHGFESKAPSPATIEDLAEYEMRDDQDQIEDQKKVDHIEEKLDWDAEWPATKKIIEKILQWKGYAPDGYFVEEWGLDPIKVRQTLKEMVENDEVELENEDTRNIPDFMGP